MKKKEKNRCARKNDLSYARNFSLLTTNVPHHIDTSQLICYVNQLPGFYMMGNIGR